MEDSLLLARAQFGLNIGFHILFPALTIGLANDYLGYIVNEKEYPHGGYEVDERSYYGPGLGSLLAAKAGEAARKLSGPAR